MSTDEDTIPPHHWTDHKTGERFVWGGLATCLCPRCHRLFTSGKAFDSHFTIERGGITVCSDPATRRKRDDTPMFEKIDKPRFNPDHVWSLAQTQRDRARYAAFIDQHE